MEEENTTPLLNTAQTKTPVPSQVVEPKKTKVWLYLAVPGVLLLLMFGFAVGKRYIVGPTFNLNSSFSIAVGKNATENSLGRLNIRVDSISGAGAQVTVVENCPRYINCAMSPKETVWMLPNQPFDFRNYSIVLTRISDRYATFSVTSSYAIPEPERYPPHYPSSYKSL